VDRRGLALPAGTAASDFNAHPSTLKKDKIYLIPRPPVCGPHDLAVGCARSLEALGKVAALGTADNAALSAVVPPSQGLQSTAAPAPAALPSLR